MSKRWWCVGALIVAWLTGCGGNVSVAPEAPVVTVHGAPGVASPGTPDTPPDPGADPPTTLTTQLWASAEPGGPQWRLVVGDDLSFRGWWVEEHDSGPPSYGVVIGGLQPPVDGGPFTSPDATVMHLPTQGTAFRAISLSAPVGKQVDIGFDSRTFSTRADPLAHQDIPMAQRSGDYAGELVLPGRREPVSLHWAADGQVSLSLTDLASGDCHASGQVLAQPGEPARVLSLALTFAGAACPPANATTHLSGLTVRARIDTASADAFVLFGSEPVLNMPLLLAATRVPAVALLGAWTGMNADSQEFHVAVFNTNLGRPGVRGWTRKPNANPPNTYTYGLVEGDLDLPAADANRFSQRFLLYLAALNYDNRYIDFSGPLPVSANMQGQFDSSAASLQPSPIAQLALPMHERVGRYAGELQLPGLREPSELTWDAQGNLNLNLTQRAGQGPGGDLSCGATGSIIATALEPARWLRFTLTFNGNNCPLTSTGVNPSGRIVRGSIDAASGDAFVLFGMNDVSEGFTLPAVLPAKRVP